MSIKVCVYADTNEYPEGGGHMWVYLNWALGLRSLDCEVFWLEEISLNNTPEVLKANIVALRRRLERYGLADRMALCLSSGKSLPREVAGGSLDLSEAREADLLLNLRSGASPSVVKRFRRSALVDIDPGLLQLWIVNGYKVAPHDVYFSTGETVGKPEAQFPDAGLKWLYTPPCVALDWWPLRSAARGASYTTVSHWYMEDWVVDGGECYDNSKRAGFLPFLNLPKQTMQPLELALCLSADDEVEREVLQEKGWRVRDGQAVASTPWDYQSYIQDSLGEFSCAKPSCIRLQNAWISDRTVCYLASGKPTIVQHTGSSSFLPDAAGMFRFRDLNEVTRHLETVTADYEHQCRLARSLAEEYFDGRKVAKRVLELALA